MKMISALRPLAAMLLLTGSLTACSTGSDNGSTNVERDDNKSPDPTDMRPNNTGADSATAGLNPDTARTSVRDQYENAADAKDRNRDGIAD
ncbi:hypothetical protein CDA63_00600 [Hymenobacter amundsenii]|uniref:EF-hand domain-containing protein n=1 Tax=Hymenobacter amundsenii TaxID=2006685 RepID=A0A246FQ84_9BACT|nr:hypothetical protein [Hymenobacter amundsenii]OWP64892.1 hypothetical protein CDA63_00600 [Hymenobacter amundsenii]